MDQSRVPPHLRRLIDKKRQSEAEESIIQEAVAKQTETSAGETPTQSEGQPTETKVEASSLISVHESAVDQESFETKDGRLPESTEHTNHANPSPQVEQQQVDEKSDPPTQTPQHLLEEEPSEQHDPNASSVGTDPHILEQIDQSTDAPQALALDSRISSEQTPAQSHPDMSQVTSWNVLFFL
eukprot:c20002_g1_i6.p1 GENE.c20002_g1_i6~~c20002_g1_i6.p1  ORF type:complete len:196 (+),score=46.25 c20002_g1_i6:41-589(+)